MYVLPINKVGGGHGARVIIFEPVIDMWHQPGGMVNEEFRKASRETTRSAKVRAPKRTTELASSIRSRNQLGGRKKVRFIVAADAPYAYYVHEGTGAYGSTGRIFIHSTRPGGMMKVPVRREPGPRNVEPRKLRAFVEGQKSNPFLRDAAQEVFAPVIRGAV